MTGLRIRVRGQVQGVGFRPFIWALADGMGLRGEVLNDAEGVLILAEGPGVEQLETRIRAKAPPLSRIDAIEVEPCVVPPDRKGFAIVRSQGAGAQTRITPDAATCADCLREVQTPGDRRFGYAFANCTNCGPRFSIIRAIPYDRAQTTMAEFALCPDCRAEYDNPADRRFHAQPVACPACGPELWFEVDERVSGDPIALAIAALRQGQVVAIKGLGGFHLACDARNAAAIQTLRTRKHRPAKPFALMGTLAMIRLHCAVSAPEEALLQDPAAPIVLLRTEGQPLPDGIAPGQGALGWMLPSTPLHHLLVAGFGGPLVMTSGNLSGEPQVIGNDEARDKLRAFADGFLMHNRQIARRLDDSVERITPAGPMVLRRGRGRVPGTLPLPPGFEDAPQVAAYGGQMKGAICLIKGGQALLGHHLGDLDDALCHDAFLQADRDYAQLFDHKADLAACDLHPEFAASRHAHALGVPVTEVQHHHAHMAACLGENGWSGGMAVGLILDGLGLGPDGTVWGGEVLTGGYRSVDRACHLKPAPLPGGDRAQLEPWRNAVMRLDAAGLHADADRLFTDRPVALLRQVAASGLNTPLSSSAGRLFDAVAACLGICPGGQSYEGEAAMRLEALAQGQDGGAGYGFDRDDGGLDPAPMFRQLLSDLRAGQDPGAIAARFHAGLARSFAQAAKAAADVAGTRTIALSGGCFQNSLLQTLVVQNCPGYDLHLHHHTPANDGGLALGQALVAAARHMDSA